MSKKELKIKNRERGCPKSRVFSFVFLGAIEFLDQRFQFLLAGTNQLFNNFAIFVDEKRRHGTYTCIRAHIFKLVDVDLQKSNISVGLRELLEKRPNHFARTTF